MILDSICRCDVEHLERLRWALAIAHPGHECRVWRWVELLCPRVVVLTDGSGGAGKPCIARTAELLRTAGATPSTMFGVAADSDVYNAVLARDFKYFRGLACQLAETLVRDRIECVLGDAAEGQIMVHDLFRDVRTSAVAMAEEVLGRPIRQFEFALESHPLAIPRGCGNQSHHVRLNDDEFLRKIAIIESYEQLAPFVADAFSKFGKESFAREGIFPFTPGSLMPTNLRQPLGYELHGLRQCALGRYREVITRADHLLPIAADLATWSGPAATRSRSATAFAA